LAKLGVRIDQKDILSSCTPIHHVKNPITRSRPPYPRLSTDLKTASIEVKPVNAILDETQWQIKDFAICEYMPRDIFESTILGISSNNHLLPSDAEMNAIFFHRG
jgi:hypothetical protein